MQQIDVVMVGLGYIGLPTAALMGGKGLKVHGVDINPLVIDTINAGKIHIVEPDLAGLVHHTVNSGFLRASTQPATAPVYLIAVPTPFKNDHEPDISYVMDAGRNLAPFLNEGALVVLESTSPVRTTEKLKELLDDLRPELRNKYFIAYCPERVLPGNVIYELEHNDRVIGGIDDASTEKAMAFYSRFIKGTLHPTTARTAEMCKLVENSYRDVNIAFANELSLICDEAGINVWQLIHLANKHPRVNVLQPSSGVGGHCIAVDPWFIVHDFPKQAKMIRAAREVNNYKSAWVFEKVRNTALEFELKNGRKPLIACMGLAFKPNIDDLRESPALEITHKLVEAGFNIEAVEPNIQSIQGIKLTDIPTALRDADILAYFVGHSQFKKENTDKILLDFCGILNR
ncbi:UDP-N-acetyl-D-mannosamine dehydrogenase [Chitinophaga rhizosphaerae]|uniref:UDP-N-acetyl-D-mannosamine dehydrogenase n=1 Tax=Chitinophaga rhizosphaerae TaxID=1864947 RepID=UPI0013DF6B8A|nr:UDP-N-acetyl-D-mannosamine dehydrogenase [Chitinophaga rhizosphaerae]